MGKIETKKYWYIKGNKITTQKIGDFYIQAIYDRFGEIEDYTIRKIINDYSYETLFLYKDQDYFPISINFLSDLYEIKDTNNPVIIKFLRKKKLERLII